MEERDQLLVRIRGEYLEMPGLSLTLPQACRLWQLDAATCAAVLQQMIDARILYRTSDNRYLALPARATTLGGRLRMMRGVRGTA
jgi:hypothetical protein